MRGSEVKWVGWSVSCTVGGNTKSIKVDAVQACGPNHSIYSGYLMMLLAHLTYIWGCNWSASVGY